MGKRGASALREVLAKPALHDVSADEHPAETILYSACITQAFNLGFLHFLLCQERGFHPIAHLKFLQNVRHVMLHCLFR